MNKYAPLATLILWALPFSAVAETPLPSTAIIVTQSADGAGWNITLPKGAEKTLTDQIWLVVDGKSEGFGGAIFLALIPTSQCITRPA